MRNLLIAALFHDFDHPGHPHPSEGDPDRINVPIPIAGLRRYVMPADRPFLPQIEALIEATHYPYKIGSDKLDLLGQIIRNADLARFTVDRLMSIINRLGSRVEVKIKVRRARTAEPGISLSRE